MVAHKHKLYKTTTARFAPEEPAAEPEKRQDTPPPSPPQPARAPDLRLGILAVQAIPQPVALFMTNGTIVFTNNAFRSFYRSITGQTEAQAATIEDLPEICKKIWVAGTDRLREGKGFSINGPVQLRGTSQRFRVDMLPIMEKGILHFIVAIILPADNTITGPALPDSSGNLLEEAIGTVKEIRFLASSEDTYRLHQIVTRADEVIRNLGEIRHISYPGQGEKKSGQIVTG